MPKMKELPDTTTATHIYEDLAVIYVEGEMDKSILERLFPAVLGEKIKFKCPETEDGTHLGGCCAVIKRVETERPHAPVWGLVDRDVMRHKCWWDRLYEHRDEEFKQDEAFDQNRRLGPGVEVLLLWEIECYLIVAEVLEEFRCDVGKFMGNQRRRPDDTAEEILEICRILLPCAAANSYLHERGLATLSTDYGKHLRDDKSMERQVRQAVPAHTDNPGAWSFDDHFGAVVRMAPARDVPSSQALGMILRVVDGKALLNRLCAKWGFRDTWTLRLARDIGRKGPGASRDLGIFIERVIKERSEAARAR